MRGRVLFGLTALVVVMALAAGLIALAARSAGPDRDVVSVSVSSLRRDHATAVDVVLPGVEGRRARVFFVRQDQEVHAFLGVSTHLGCALRSPGDKSYGNGFASDPKVATFEDPCGGSTFGFDGTCVGGPCPCGLDRYRVQIKGNAAEIDLTNLIPGPPRSYATT